MGLATSAAAGELTLEELMRRMAASPGVEASFRETRELRLLSAPLESRGRLYFVPPDRLARFTTAPGESALIVDGENLRYREGPDEIDLSASPAARGFADNLMLLFRGDLERLQKSYDTTFSAEGPRWSLVLAPRRAPLDRVIERIALRGDDGGLRQVVVHDTDGSRTTTVFENAVPRRRFSVEELEELFPTAP